MKNQGLALPSLLIIFSFCLLTSAPLAFQCVKTLRNISEEKSGDSLNNLSFSKSLVASFSYAADFNLQNEIKCHTETSEMGRFDYKIDFCSIKPQSYQLAHAKIESSRASLNFDSLTGSNQECSRLEKNNHSTFSVTNGFFAGRSCILNQQLTKNNYFKANLVSDSLLAISNSATLSAAGFMHFNTLLIRGTAEFTLFAAGEIVIDQISTDRPINLRVISASGDIKINKIDSTVNLAVFSRQKVFTPVNTKFSATSFADLQIFYQPLGFSY